VSNKRPRCYLILGAIGSGRREVLADLAVQLEGPAKTLLLTEASEPGDPADALLEPLVSRGVYTLGFDSQGADSRCQLELEPGALDGFDVVFVLAPGTGDPVDFVEAAADWLPTSGLDLARVLMVLHCQLAERKPQFRPWFDACILFADYVLLNRRDGVSNKWMSDLQRHFKELCYPCHFEMVKQGRVRNPAFVLLEEARRMAQIFDRDPEADFAEVEVLVETEDGEELPLEDAGDPETEEDAPALDPQEQRLFERMPNGKRRHPLPSLSAETA
jgi:hypothetical protein